MSSTMKIIAKNPKARFNYFIDKEFEAGIVLTGSEVKAIREGKIMLTDSHAAQVKSELYLFNCHISEYDKANRLNHVTKRPRKLLLHKIEIKNIINKIKLKGSTFIALSVYFNNKNLIKVKLGLARGKKNYDKRQTIKNKDWQREQGRLTRNKE